MNRLCTIGLAASLAALLIADGGLGDAVGAAGVAMLVPATAITNGGLRTTSRLVASLARTAVLAGAVAAAIAVLTAPLADGGLLADVAFGAALAVAVVAGMTGALIELATATRRDGLLFSLGLAGASPRNDGGRAA
jgi:hypothetical protein